MEIQVLPHWPRCSTPGCLLPCYLGAGLARLCRWCWQRRRPR